MHSKVVQVLNAEIMGLTLLRLKFCALPLRASWLVVSLRGLKARL